MDDDEVHGSVEWKALKSLRSYRTRLVRLQYQSLKMAQKQAPGEIAQISVPENDIRFLDSGLRLLFIRKDLDALLGRGLLDPPTAETVQGHLKSLCALLEKHVNEALVPSSPPTARQHAGADDYPRLDALVGLLAATNWSFELVTGKGRRIFQPDPISAAVQTGESDSIPDVEEARESVSIPGASLAKDQIDGFNDFLDRLCPPHLDDILAPAETARVSHWKGDGFRGRTLLALEALFSSLTTLQQCDHRVLVQLPDWASIESDGPSSSRVMKLFLSTCPDSSNWQEGQIDDLSSM